MEANKKKYMDGNLKSMIGKEVGNKHTQTQKKAGHDKISKLPQSFKDLKTVLLITLTIT